VTVPWMEAWSAAKTVIGKLMHNKYKRKERSGWQFASTVFPSEESEGSVS
jgi:hypothetical protein